jgi:Patatin-like phospholipase
VASTLIEELLKEAGRDETVLSELAALGEPQRRRVLRPHQERPLDDQKEMDLRHRLDQQLDRLMLLELCVELHALEPTEISAVPGLAELLKGVRPAGRDTKSPEDARGSAAFARYLTSYLYFGVRFAATRLSDEGNGAAHDVPPLEADMNEVPIALPIPPPIAGLGVEERERAVQLLTRSLGLCRASPVAEALDFLDDIVEFPGEQDEYALWLRGLGGAGKHEELFHRLTVGLLGFAAAKAELFPALESRPDWPPNGPRNPSPAGPWSATNPLTARVGMLDFYWLARLLCADVSADGIVSYRSPHSWLHELGGRVPAELGFSPDRILEIEDILRAVFDFSCDLVQNAAEIAIERLRYLRKPEDFGTCPASTADWRATFDEELEEIVRQRNARRFEDAPPFEPYADGGSGGRPGHPGWSRRSRTGAHVPDLIGLAFSGGGIRSATFNLGVLQRLQELDLLRQVDYLSTVSGGGYIGAWLLGNVRRTRYWLARLTDWAPSIEHLRRFSNYLAPRTGLMSADTWTMWGTWVRNALLVQIGAATWLAVLLVLTLLNKSVFCLPIFACLARHPFNLGLGAILALPTFCACRDLRRQSGAMSERLVLWLGVIPAWIGAFATAGMLWASPTGEPFGSLLQGRWRDWLGPLLLLFGALWSVASISTELRWWRRLLLGAAAALISTAFAYLGLCGIHWVLGLWSGAPPGGAWWAYVASGPAVLLVLAAAVGLMIGVLGLASPDWRREWWTRFGSWLGIYGVSFLGLSLTAVFGPWLAIWALDLTSDRLNWSTVMSVVGWIGTVIGGLLAGNSHRTNGAEEGGLATRALGGFAKLAAFVFIVGAVLIASTGLHVLLLKVWTSKSLDLLKYWDGLEAVGPVPLLWSLLAFVSAGLVFSWRFDINIFGLNEFYRNRLVRCYLGATRWSPGLRKPNRFTGFDGADDLPLSDLRHGAVPSRPPYRGPFPIVNCSLNLGGSSDLLLHTRHSASFTLTPLRSGADRRQVGYAPTPAFAGGVSLGRAIAVSGAAASPNMGYNTSPLVAFLLTMFNVRLGRWLPNPGRESWCSPSLRFSLAYLVMELFALADERADFVNVSDGGHFENLGIYELVRRRCKVIIAADAECDPELAFSSLGAVVRMCKTDFGASIEIDVESIRKEKDSRLSRAHCAVGTIAYANGSLGHLIYLKASLTGDEDVSVQQYKACHADFPHESTGDQFFAEDQFESYRRLGDHVARLTFRGVESEPSIIIKAKRLAKLWVPASVGSLLFVEQATAMERVWERLRESSTLWPLLHELTHGEPAPARPPGPIPNEEELCLCQELLQLMENVFLALRLDDFWDHPDNRGWAVSFSTWAKSPIFRAVWAISRETYGIRFGYFCEQRLGLPR